MTLEKMLETVIAGNGRLIVIADGRKLRCFRCSKKDHIHSECKPKEQKLGVPTAETEEEKVEVEEANITAEKEEKNEIATEGATKKKKNNREQKMGN